MRSPDIFDWLFLGTLLLMAIVGIIEYAVGEKKLAKGTFMWTSIVAIFFVMSLFFR